MSALSRGILEVVVGSMFSGKTEEAIRRARRAVYARQRVQVFKPVIDTRESEDVIMSHSKQRLEAIRVDDTVNMTERLLTDVQVVVIDEGQFFGENLVDFAVGQRAVGRRVIIAGLDMNYLGEPFHPMPHLLAIADLIDKKRAICTKCGDEATYSQRIVNRDAVLHVGGKDDYEARCRFHWNPTKFE